MASCAALRQAPLAGRPSGQQQQHAMAVAGRPAAAAAPLAAPQRQRQQQRRRSRQPLVTAAAGKAAGASNVTQPAVSRNGPAPTDIEYDAVIIGSGMGGLSTAAQLAAKGAKVVVLEK